MGGKNIQYSVRFLTTFDFDRKYLWNGSTYRKSEKYLIDQLNFIPYWAKKFVNFGPQTKKL